MEIVVDERGETDRIVQLAAGGARKVEITLEVGAVAD